VDGKGWTLQLPDAVVAAICIEKNCVLVTDNRKEFANARSAALSAAVIRENPHPENHRNAAPKAASWLGLSATRPG
jgi:hypothetical protein